MGLHVTCFCAELQIVELCQFREHLIHEVIFKLFSDLKNAKIDEFSS